ncbi:DUF7504 family protein [Halomicrobium katesii]|uniref:DUF7504 family protein n=1 Tax=Halomicrobium katesii TaxID=437163 RepID=UPI00036A5BC6|nr:hypothetical protein [Halomicrobium katesii]
MQSVIDRLDGVTTLLLCGSCARTDELCGRLLAEGGAAGRTVLWVSFGQSPSECLDDTVAADADRAVLAVGTTPAGERDDDVTVEVISTPSDLAALGIKLSQFIAETDGELTVCFDSLTELLGHVAVETAYEFLHTVTRQCYLADARAHFHLDPAAHDAQAVASITSLCDARVDLDSTPPVRVRNDR